MTQLKQEFYLRPHEVTREHLVVEVTSVIYESGEILFVERYTANGVIELILRSRDGYIRIGEGSVTSHQRISIVYSGTALRVVNDAGRVSYEEPLCNSRFTIFVPLRDIPAIISNGKASNYAIMHDGVVVILQGNKVFVSKTLPPRYVKIGCLNALM